MFKAIPCACGFHTCRSWHVFPSADVQGVAFTEEQAKRVAELLNEMEKEDAIKKKRSGYAKRPRQAVRGA